jgi:hypothetical protein
LFGEKFFARHLSGSRYYPSPKANTPQRRIRSREKYKSERKAAVPEIMSGAHHR